jgi:tungstate transport system permease protein
MNPIWHATVLSVGISLGATLLASLLGIPAAGWCVTGRGRLRRMMEEISHATLVIPTVLIGLLVFLLLCRRGPLAALDLLFTPWAILIGETLLALPIMTALSASALRAVDPRATETARALGGRGIRLVRTLLRENPHGLAAAATMTFARVVSEVGCAVMVGGNMPGRTRTLTTAMMLEVQQRGDLEAGLRLGGLLLAVAVPVILTGRWLQHRALR